MAGPCLALPAKDSATVKVATIKEKDFTDRTINIPGQGRIRGFAPGFFGSSGRYIIADDSTFSAFDLDDRKWPRPSAIDSLLRQKAPVAWMRFHFKLDSSVADDAITMRVRIPGTATLWLDGEQVMNTSFTSDDRPHGGSFALDTTAILEFQLGRLARGVPHVLALRVSSNTGRNALQDAVVWLYRPSAIADLHRHAMHNGVFIGVNAFMLLMALIFWRMDRHDRIWPWFAGLLGTNAFIAFTDLLEYMSLGLTTDTRDRLTDMGDFAWSVPIALSVMILLVALGRDSRKKMLLYSAAALLMCGIMVLGKTVALDNEGLFAQFEWKAWAQLGLLVLLGLVGFLWLLVDAIRYGWHAFRSPGFIKWIGAGVLLSLLAPVLPGIIAIIIAIVAHVENASPPAGLTTSMAYVSHVAVPLSIIVSLALRSAFQNRLLARQRDELDKEVHDRTAELKLERDRSENLLLNILPQEVAEELKQKGSADARHYDQVTVLFTDFKGFTSMSEQMPPGELLTELNACFHAFDDIIARYGIEKIKTIGDAYMCAAGLPDPYHAGPVDVVQAALDMQAFIGERRRQRQAAGAFAFEMRSGIHTGPVVAGIVGVKKFQYDIWGDTVNTAARMETAGEVGRVNISPATYARIKDAPGLRFIPRGGVEVKGKGTMEMWFVERA
ncbi:MAG: hypothetical protein GFGODING_01161 [Flavobacteriales bacterium]|nr:hypothetical protein [Flavobacteriales bacterium]